VSHVILPLLILHPFANCGRADKLVESARVSLMLQGLLPSGDRTADDLDRNLARRTPFRNRDALLCRSGPFAAYLANHTPSQVPTKLRRWGVVDYRAIFTRALGLNALFVEPPEQSSLSLDFIRNSYRYSYQVFSCRQGQARSLASKTWALPLKSTLLANTRECSSANGRHKKFPLGRSLLLNSSNAPAHQYRSHPMTPSRKAMWPMFSEP
jgi:hypothetical protein